MSVTKRNLLANYCGTMVVAASQVVVIPLYLRFLGEHDWGLLSSIIALSATLLILEAGVSQAVARRFSVKTTDQPWINRHAFEALERRYLGLTLTVSIVLALFAHQIGPLLIPRAGDRGQAFTLIAILMSAAQIVGSLYRGTLIGYGTQVRLNVVVIAMTCLRHGLGVFVAAKGAGVHGVALVFALSFVVESTLRRWLVSGLLSPRKIASRQGAGDIYQPVARGALMLAIAGTVGALSTQLDRLILGVSISAVDLGRYSIAATLSLAALQVIYPINNALMPRLRAFDDVRTRHGIVSGYYKVLFGILVLLWCGAVLVALEGLQHWLPRVGSAVTASVVGPLFLVHLIGTSFNALSVPAYMTLLARHLDRRILFANLCALAVLVVVLVLFTPRYGAMAGSLAWATSNAALLALYFGMQKSKSENT